MEKCKASFYPLFLSEWSNLDPVLTASPSVETFEKLVIAKIRLAGSSPYGMKNQKGKKLSTKLRVRLSQLNFHKCQHNSRNPTNASYQNSDGVEDIAICCCETLLKSTERLLTGVETVLQANNCLSYSSYGILELLSYGHSSQSFRVNKSILKNDSLI